MRSVPSSRAAPETFPSVWSRACGFVALGVVADASRTAAAGRSAGVLVRTESTVMRSPPSGWPCVRWRCGVRGRCRAVVVLEHRDISIDLARRSCYAQKL